MRTIQSALNKENFVKFRPLRTKLQALMLTYPKSTMRVRRMPMHLSSGHVTLMPRKFYRPPLYSPLIPPIGLRALGGLTFGFAPNF